MCMMLSKEIRRPQFLNVMQQSCPLEYILLFNAKRLERVVIHHKVKYIQSMNLYNLVFNLAKLVPVRYSRNNFITNFSNHICSHCSKEFPISQCSIVFKYIKIPTYLYCVSKIYFTIKISNGFH